MLINGKEVHFKATVGALIQISELCPEGDVNRVSELVTGMNASSLKASIKLISYLSAGTLTEAELMNMEVPQLQELLDEAFKAFREDQNGKVEVVPKKDEATEADA